MNLGISAEQAELRESVRRFLTERAPLHASPRADGDRGQDRPRRLAAGQRSAGPAGDRGSRGVRRGRFLLRRAVHRPRGARRRPVHRTVPGQRGAGRHHHAAGQRRHRSQKGPAAGHRRGGDRRHAGLHRGRRILGTGLDPAGRHESDGERLAAQAARRASSSTATPPTSSWSSRLPEQDGTLSLSRAVARHSKRAHPAAAAHAGPDQETGPAGVRPHASPAGREVRRGPGRARSHARRGGRRARGGAGRRRAARLDMAVAYAKIRQQFGGRSAASRRSSTGAPTCC